MSIGRGPTQAVTEVSKSTETVPAKAEPLEASPLFGVAMLKIAMELKKADARPLDELIHGVLQRMRLPEEEFKAYLSANGGLLKRIAQGRGY